MSRRRVAITGLGAVTPLGDLRATCAAIREGRSAIGAVRAFDASAFPCTLAAECDTFDMRRFFHQPKTLKVTDRRIRFAVAAGSMAAASAGLDPEAGESLGVIIGTSGFDVQTEDLGRAVGKEGDPMDIDYFGARILRRLNPLWLLINLANMTSAHVAIQLQAHGPNSTLTTDWIAGIQALGEAARLIASGEAEAMVAGGADSAVLPFVYGAWGSGGAPDGVVPGEGAALFVLEEMERARARGARIVGEISGFASSIGESAGKALAASGWAEPDVECDDVRLASSIGHAFSAAAPITLAVLLRSSAADAMSEGTRLLVTSRGSQGQSASLAVTTGSPNG